MGPDVPAAREEPLPRIRRVIADRMMASLRESAQLTTVMEADVTTLTRYRRAWKQAFQQRHGVALTYLPFFAHAAVQALRDHEVINARLNLDSGTVHYNLVQHLGVAVDTERGLLVPVIPDAGSMSVAELALAIADVADRARTRRISPDELSGGTFTVSNTGSRGALFDTPIINQPQVAILGIGAVVQRPAVVDGEIEVRDLCHLALTYDHRLVDGADASRYLATVRSRLETLDLPPLND